MLLNAYARVSFRIKYLADRTGGYSFGRRQEHYRFHRNEKRLDSWASG